MPHTIYDSRPETPEAKMLQFIREKFPKVPITKIPRRHFNLTDGMDLLKQYASTQYDNVRRSVESKYYALTAVSGLMKYLQYVFSLVFIEQSLKLTFETKFGHMLIGNSVFNHCRHCNRLKNNNFSPLQTSTAATALNYYRPCHRWPNRKQTNVRRFSHWWTIATLKLANERCVLAS